MTAPENISIRRPSNWPPTIDRADYEDGQDDDAYARLSYGLTYAHAVRSLWSGGMDGPNIPNAYDPKDTGPGEWCHDITDCDNDPVLHALSMAVAEAVHEALEWLRLDGDILLDPHGQDEAQIIALSNELSAKLFELTKIRHYRQTLETS